MRYCDRHEYAYTAGAEMPADMGAGWELWCLMRIKPSTLYPDSPRDGAHIAYYGDPDTSPYRIWRRTRRTSRIGEMLVLVDRPGSPPGCGPCTCPGDRLPAVGL